MVVSTDFPNGLHINWYHNQNVVQSSLNSSSEKHSFRLVEGLWAGQASWPLWLYNFNLTLCTLSVVSIVISNL